jgi:hypothetical protein
MVVVCQELYLVGVWQDGKATVAATAPNESVAIGLAFLIAAAAALILPLTVLKKIMVPSCCLIIDTLYNSFFSLSTIFLFKEKY